MRDSRRRRLVALGALVAALVVVAAPQAVGKASRPTPGSYSGDVGVYTLSFTVHADKITHLTTDFQAFSERGGCMPAPEVVRTRFPSLSVEDGTFHDSTSVNHSSGITQHFTIEGTFETPTKVRGKITNSYTITGLPPCHDTQSFVATLK